MQKYLFVSLLLLLLPMGTFMYLQQTADDEQQACCSLAASSEFAAFASDVKFVNKHEEPLALKFETQIGKEIKFKAADGQEARAFEWKAKGGKRDYLLVFHEWWGLNDHIKQEAEKMYNDLGGKVNVVALDLYDGTVATTREEAAKAMQALKAPRAEAIIKGYVQKAGKKANIYTVGWCLGGGWSLQAALLAATQAKGCIIYYGMPEKNVERLKTLNADVLGIFAGQEQWISPKVVEEFDQNMKAAGKKLTYKIFDADHAFANPSNPKYNKEHAAEAYRMSMDFLKGKMQ